ncbi:MAG: hypothetical protein IJ828_10895 [Treponema sp.]|nr:hypothetical protein [Treponema sp.]
MKSKLALIDNEYNTWISQIKKLILGAESRQIRHQLGDEFKDTLFTIPWRHHIEIFTRAKSIDEALFLKQRKRMELKNERVENS